MEPAQPVDLAKDNGGNSPGSSGNNAGNSPQHLPLHTSVLSGASTSEEIMRATGDHPPTDAAEPATARIGNYCEQAPDAELSNQGGLG